MNGFILQKQGGVPVLAGNSAACDFKREANNACKSADPNLPTRAD